MSIALGIQLSNIHDRLDKLEDAQYHNNFHIAMESESQMDWATIIIERLKKIEAEIACFKGVDASLVSNCMNYDGRLEILERTISNYLCTERRDSIKRIDLDEIKTALSCIQDGIDQLNHLFYQGD